MDKISVVPPGAVFVGFVVWRRERSEFLVTQDTSPDLDNDEYGPDVRKAVRFATWDDAVPHTHASQHIAVIAEAFDDGKEITLTVDEVFNSYSEPTLTDEEHKLIERENDMQEYSLKILEAAQKRGMSADDIAIVFGGIIRAQAKANAEHRGVSDIIVAEELLRKFMEGLRGVHEAPAARH